MTICTLSLFQFLLILGTCMGLGIVLGCLGAAISQRSYWPTPHPQPPHDSLVTPL